MVKLLVPVFLTAVLAFLSKWLLDGGVRRRELATAKQELELAAMLSGDLAADLEAQAHARLESYLAPTVWERVARQKQEILIVLLWIVSGATLVALAVLWKAGKVGVDDVAPNLVLTLLSGLLAGALWSWTSANNRRLEETARLAEHWARRRTVHGDDRDDEKPDRDDE